MEEKQKTLFDGLHHGETQDAIPVIVCNIKKSLDIGAYYAAISLALTIPDVCGKAEYPKDKTGDRYKKWCQEWFSKYETPPDEPESPHLTPEILYKLRCAVLHEGSNDVEETNTSNFVFLIERKNVYNIYSDFVCYNDNEVKYWEISIRRICFVLCLLAEKYYEKNKEKFSNNSKLKFVKR